jgi:hypothetical protein
MGPFQAWALRQSRTPPAGLPACSLSVMQLNGALGCDGRAFSYLRSDVPDRRACDRSKPRDVWPRSFRLRNAMDLAVPAMDLVCAWLGDPGVQPPARRDPWRQRDTRSLVRVGSAASPLPAPSRWMSRCVNHRQGLAGRSGRHDQLHLDWRANVEQTWPGNAHRPVQRDGESRRSGRVRRQGLEPRTRGSRVRCSDVRSVLSLWAYAGLCGLRLGFLPRSAGR